MGGAAKRRIPQVPMALPPVGRDMEHGAGHPDAAVGLPRTVRHAGLVGDLEEGAREVLATGLIVEHGRTYCVHGTTMYAASVQHVIFDLDGTLVENEHLSAAFRPVVVAQGADPAHVETVIATRLAYQSFEASVQEALPGLSEAQAHDVAGMMWEVADVGRLLPGAMDALATCQELGLHVYLSTGTAPSLLERTVIAHGWAETFIAAHG